MLIPVIFVVAIVGAAFLIKDRLAYKWLVNYSKASSDSVLAKLSVSPFKDWGKYVGIEVKVENQTDENLVLNWGDSFYIRDGATNGKLLNFDQPYLRQLTNPQASDLILPKSTMTRRLIPVATLQERIVRNSPTYVTVPGDDEKVPNPPRKPDPPKEPEITVHVSDGEKITPVIDGEKPPVKDNVTSIRKEKDSSKRRLGGFILKDTFSKSKDSEDSSSVAKEDDEPFNPQITAFKSDRVVILPGGKETTSEFFPMMLEDGSHGVLLSIQREGDQASQRLAASFDLSYVKVTK